MSDVSRILDRLEAGETAAAEQLLPLVYDELRRLAAAQMARESPGHSLDATALVHEAYLRLVGPVAERQFKGVRHFMAAAAEAMRHILVDSARRRMAQKRGGCARRLPLDEWMKVSDLPDEQLLELDAALAELGRHDAQLAEFVKLRAFAELGHQEAAAALGLGRRAADRHWALAKAWLFKQLRQSRDISANP